MIVIHPFVVYKARVVHAVYTEPALVQIPRPASVVVFGIVLEPLAHTMVAVVAVKDKLNAIECLSACYLLYLLLLRRVYQLRIRYLDKNSHAGIYKHVNLCGSAGILSFDELVDLQHQTVIILRFLDSVQIDPLIQLVAGL